MKTKHTRAPWVINPNGGIPIIGIELRDGGDLLPIVSTVHGYDESEADANAHLIAAAPELLDAIKRARFVMESPVFDQALMNSGGALDAVKAAIAKAEA